MSVDDLRRELVRISQQLSSWSLSLFTQRQALLVPFYEAYIGSEARSHAERQKEAEAATCRDQGGILEAEGQVAFWTCQRDLVVTLLEHGPCEP